MKLSSLKQQIEELDAKATRGPWVPYITDEFPPGWLGIRQGIESETLTETHVATLGRFNDPRDVANQDFIALSRTAMPELLRRLLVAEEALQRLGDCDWVITLPDRMDGVRAIAREALATIRGEEE